MSGGGAGLSSAFDALYQTYAHKVFAYLAAGFGPDVAEDLIQQTFVQIWQYLARQCDWAPRSWPAWVFGVARNVRNDHLRATRHRFAALPFDDAILAKQSSPAREWEEQMAVRTAWRRLRDADQELLLYKAIGLNSSEVGRILDLSASAVRSRLQQARKRFRQELIECGVETDA